MIEYLKFKIIYFCGLFKRNVHFQNAFYLSQLTECNYYIVYNRKLTQINILIYTNNHLTTLLIINNSLLRYKL